MPEKIEELIKEVFKEWKKGALKDYEAHPDEEALACFLEGRLSEGENKHLEEHLLTCDTCMEALLLNLQLNSAEEKEVPQELIFKLKGLLELIKNVPLLEVILRLKDKVFEVISTTGDLLVGRELVPAAVLRSRAIKDFKDEVFILKDFNEIRVEAKIENKVPGAFNVTISVKEKETQKTIKDLRVSLIKEGLELESYISEKGSVTFEHVLLGKYHIEVSGIEEKLASVLLDIKA